MLRGIEFYNYNSNLIWRFGSHQVDGHGQSDQMRWESLPVNEIWTISYCNIKWWFYYILSQYNLKLKVENHSKSNWWTCLCFGAGKNLWVSEKVTRIKILHSAIWTMSQNPILCIEGKIQCVMCTMSSLLESHKLQCTLILIVGSHSAN